MNPHIEGSVVAYRGQLNPDSVPDIEAHVAEYRALLEEQERVAVDQDRRCFQILEFLDIPCDDIKPDMGLFVVMMRVENDPAIAARTKDMPFTGLYADVLDVVKAMSAEERTAVKERLNGNSVSL